MTETVGGLPLLEIRIDEDGDVEAGSERALLEALDEADATDLVVFSHGWNTRPEVARRLYRAFFGRFAPLVRRHAPGRRLVLLGVFWPSIRWSDEPIPDFEGRVARSTADGAAGIAGLGEPVIPPPPPDQELRDGLLSLFADQAPALEELLDLLTTRPDSRDALARARTLMAELARAAGNPGDGEEAQAAALVAEDDPDAELFDAFALALEDAGLALDDGRGLGAAGLGDRLGRLWHGGQEVLRQLSYWKMKARAGVVGERGLGPVLAGALSQRPDLGIHLVGHSFGARVVSYALRGLPDFVGEEAARRPPVAGVTLLQGAFSHYAFSERLPFDAGRAGALHRESTKVSGAVVACYSEHDGALGTFYPLASMLHREDAAGVRDRLFRWGSVGRNGHQAGVREVRLLPAGTAYDLGGPGLVNIDAASVVRRGFPPVGAHNDIVHDELAWVVLAAGGLAGQ